MAAKYDLILAIIIPAVLLVIAIVNDHRENVKRNRWREGFR